VAKEAKIVQNFKRGLNAFFRNGRFTFVQMSIGLKFADPPLVLPGDGCSRFRRNPLMTVDEAERFVAWRAGVREIWKLKVVWGPLSSVDA